MVASFRKEVSTMFELLFSRPSAVKRHRSAPLARERAAYLKKLADQGSPLSVVRRRRVCVPLDRSADQELALRSRLVR
jgi:hypothetical protein